MSIERTGPGITGTDFLAVPTRDMARAVDFYENVLELRCSVRPSSTQRAPYAEFETGNLTLGLFAPEGMGREFRANPNPVALHVDDVKAARGILSERDVHFHGETLDTSVCHMAFFSDPDGNALMLHSRYAPRTPGR